LTNFTFQTSLASYQQLTPSDKESIVMQEWGVRRQDVIQPIETVYFSVVQIGNDAPHPTETNNVQNGSTWTLLANPYTQNNYLDCGAISYIASGTGASATFQSNIGDVVITYYLNGVSQTPTGYNAGHKPYLTIAGQTAGTILTVSATYKLGWAVIATGTISDGYITVNSGNSQSFNSTGNNKTWRLDGTIVATNTNSYTCPAQTNGTYHTVTASSS
jgi:hypothetical protein